MTVNLFDEDAVISEKVRKTTDVFSACLSDVTKTPDNWASFLTCV